MKIDTGLAISSIVDALLPYFTADKLLHIALNIQYLCFPKKPGKSMVSARIENRINLHYVFRREKTWTMVLRCIKESPFFIEDGDEFYLTAYHDCCWRTDGLADLDRVHYESMKEIGKQYKIITKQDMPHIELLQQPNTVLFGQVELIKGKTTGSEYGPRNYCAKVSIGNIDLIQIEP